MATRNSNNKKKTTIPTRRTFSAKSYLRRPPDTSHISEVQSTHSSNPVTRRSSSTAQNGIKTQPQVQNFSSRNSLRTAQPFTASSQHTYNHFTMPNIDDFIWSNQTNLVNSVRDSRNYDLMSSESFLRGDKDHLLCMLCGRRERMVTENSADIHLTSELHNRRFCDLRSYLVQQVPEDSGLQMNALRELLINWYKQQSLKDEVINSRISVVHEFETLLNRVTPDCHLRLIGSMMTGTPLMSSDINLELVHPNSDIFEADPRSKNSIHHKLINPDAEIGHQINSHTVHYDLIPNAIDTLYKVMNAINNRYQGCPTSSFKVVSKLNDLNAKVPKIVLRHEYSRTLLKVCCYAESSHKLAILLRTYMSLDPRATILGVLVKHWAKICKIDNPDHGTYPPDVYIILVIYYLQRTTPPILPCLHEFITKNSRTETRNNQTEEAPSNLFGKLSVKEDNKSTTNSMDERPKVNNLDVKENSNNHPEALDDNLEEEVDEEDEDDDFINLNSDVLKNVDWNSSNNQPVHKLFLDFLMFMSHEFNDIRNVISIRTLKEVALKSKRYVTVVKAIENPVRPKSNMSCCVGTPRTFEYIKQCFSQAYQYLICLPVDDRLKPKLKKEGHFDPCEYTDLYINTHRFHNYFFMKKDSIQNKCNYNPIDEMINQNLFARDVEAINALFDIMPPGSSDVTKLPGIVARSYSEKCIVPKDVAATVFCWLCKGIGHARQACHRGKIENLDKDFESYDVKLDIEAEFDSDFIDLYNEDKITPELSVTHNNIVNRLQKLINAATRLDCRLELFGSTVNNLGSADSDLDICLTLNGNPTGKGVDCVAVLSQVNSVLVREDCIDSVEPILSARVPIIKFRFSHFDVDLSMYNQCAIFNSKLLKAYAILDSRVAQLFYLVKRYAKACKIADASRGSLSSYAWSLLVIHYLQQTTPPILPVLQEVPHGTQTPLYGVNGWNVWFNDSYIQHRCPSNPENPMTLTQLFKGFFLYYSHFDFNYHVVSIRKAQKLTRFQKNWNNCAMAIEDPFELTYNLASRLDEPMAIFIINSFAYAFRNIVRIQKEYRERKRLNKINIHSRRNLVEGIFSNRNITDSNPPYRGCRVCHRIGHKFKDCPERNANRNQDDNSRLRTKTN